MVWCVSISVTLKRADKRIGGIKYQAPFKRKDQGHGETPTTTLSVYLFSYVDDINPLVISRNTSKETHNKGVGTVIEELEEELAPNATKLRKAGSI